MSRSLPGRANPVACVKNKGGMVCEKQGRDVVEEEGWWCVYVMVVVVVVVVVVWVVGWVGYSLCVYNAYLRAKQHMSSANSKNHSIHTQFTVHIPESQTTQHVRLGTFHLQHDPLHALQQLLQQLPVSNWWVWYVHIGDVCIFRVCIYILHVVIEHAPTMHVCLSMVYSHPLTLSLTLSETNKQTNINKHTCGNGSALAAKATIS